MYIIRKKILDIKNEDVLTKVFKIIYLFSYLLIIYLFH